MISFGGCTVTVEKCWLIWPSRKKKVLYPLSCNVFTIRKQLFQQLLKKLHLAQQLSTYNTCQLMSLRGAGKLGLNSSGFSSAFSFYTAKLITQASFSCRGGDGLFFSPCVETTASPLSLFICLASHYFPTRFLCPTYRKTLSCVQQVGNERCERTDRENVQEDVSRLKEPSSSPHPQEVDRAPQGFILQAGSGQWNHSGKEILALPNDSQRRRVEERTPVLMRCRNGDKLVGKEASHS